MKKIFILAAISFVSSMGFSQIENDTFTAGDLSKEVVYPKVDYPEMVLNKKLTFTDRWDVSFDKISVTD